MTTTMMLGSTFGTKRAAGHLSPGVVRECASRQAAAGQGLRQIVGGAAAWFSFARQTASA